jgi:hypothetical protein
MPPSMSEVQTLALGILEHRGTWGGGLGEQEAVNVYS